MTDAESLRSWSLPITKTTIFELDGYSVLIRSDGQRFPVLRDGGEAIGYLVLSLPAAGGFDGSWRHERDGIPSEMSYATAEGALRGLHAAVTAQP
jgi:hypothetical protein